MSLDLGSAPLLPGPTPRRRKLRGRAVQPRDEPLRGSTSLVLISWLAYLRYDVVYEERATTTFLGSLLGIGQEAAHLAFMQLYVHEVLEMDFTVGPSGISIDAEEGEWDGDTTWQLRPRWTDKRYESSARGVKRPAIDRELREAVLIRDRGQCRYCRASVSDRQLDHVVPHSAGGPTSVNNIVLACTPCNASKSNKLWVPLPA